jgi:hypothetical protein
VLIFSEFTWKALNIAWSVPVWSGHARADARRYALTTGGEVSRILKRHRGGRGSPPPAARRGRLGLRIPAGVWPSSRPNRSHCLKVHHCILDEDSNHDFSPTGGLPVCSAGTIAPTRSRAQEGQALPDGNSMESKYSFHSITYLRVGTGVWYKY